MFVKKKKNRSGTTSVVVSEKHKNTYKEYVTIGIISDPIEIEELVNKGNQWIANKKQSQSPSLDLFGESRQANNDEISQVECFISNISNVLINGTQLILDRVFDRIGFNAISDNIFRQLVQARLSYPTSKVGTVEYLKNHFDQDVDLSKIYRYLDKLNHTQSNLIQQISVEHTQSIYGGKIGALFYDVTTLYFESDNEDDFRKSGFSKEGRHSNPQIILGLLVSDQGYPLAYTIHEGNKYEGHTMLPVIKRFVKQHDLRDFVVVADSGLMTESNLLELERLGYKYIIGARIKNY